MSTGRQYLAAEEVLYAARHASYQESLDAGVQCFILAIEVCVCGCVHVQFILDCLCRHMRNGKTT